MLHDHVALVFSILLLEIHEHEELKGGACDNAQTYLEHVLNVREGMYSIFHLLLCLNDFLAMRIGIKSSFS